MRRSSATEDNATHRQLEITIALARDSGFSKFGVTPAGGGIAGTSPPAAASCDLGNCIVKILAANWLQIVCWHRGNEKCEWCCDVRTDLGSRQLVEI
jgi:hypothetical protein